MAALACLFRRLPLREILGHGTSCCFSRSYCGASQAMYLQVPFGTYPFRLSVHSSPGEDAGLGHPLLRPSLFPFCQPFDQRPRANRHSAYSQSSSINGHIKVIFVTNCTVLASWYSVLSTAFIALLRVYLFFTPHMSYVSFPWDSFPT